jgi:ribose transport system permease protein
MNALTTTLKPTQPRGLARLLPTLLRRGTVFLVLVGLGIFFASRTERFFVGDNLVNILAQNAAIVVVATGMTLVMLQGGIDLSVGSVAALAGAISAGLIVRDKWPVELGIVAGLAVGLMVGAVNGGLVVFGKLPPFVATLASMTAVRGLVLVYTAGRPISGMGESYTFWGRGFIGPLPASVIVAASVAVMALFILTRTRFGLHLYAIGGGEETSRLAGVPVGRVKIQAYAVSGLLAALGGILLTARLFSAQPQLGVGLELDAIAASVLGGVSLFGGIGNAFSPVFGALLVGTLRNGLSLLQVPSYPQQIIQGVVLVSAVAVDMLAKRLERRK